MGDQKNLIIAFVVSVAILIGWEMYRSENPTPDQPVESAQTTSSSIPIPAAPSDTSSMAPVAPGAPVAPAVPGSVTPAVPGSMVAPVVPHRDQVLAQVDRVKINSSRLAGSISIKGARLDDLMLHGYKAELADNSPDVTLLSPSGSENGYYAEFGWAAAAGQGTVLPTEDTIWTTNSQELTPNNPVTFTWNNGQGLTFSRTFAVDENYMFSVSQRVENNSTGPVTLYPFGLISRSNTPDILGLYILHEGPLGVLDGTLTEVDYSQLQEDGPIKTPSTGGWIGITDKYWLTALIPDQSAKVDTTFFHRKVGEKDRYQTDYLGAAVIIPQGQASQVDNQFFAGAKEVALLDAYTDTLGIDRLDLAVDFGWFYFLTKPFFYSLSWLASHIGNFGVAILVFTMGVKLVLFPLANKSYKAMAKMKIISPKMKALQARFKDDKVRLNQELMALYKKEGANPAAGCLPIIVQIPIFFSLYKVLYVTIEMRHAPFFGWIQDLSAPDPTSVFNLFGLIPWDPPHALMLGVWPLIMGFTMWLQQQLNPAPTDPIQAKVMKMLPFVFTFILASFPAGLVVYWAWNNSLSVLQQWWIMRGQKAANS